MAFDRISPAAVALAVVPLDTTSVLWGAISGSLALDA